MSPDKRPQRARPPAELKPVKAAPAPTDAYEIAYFKRHSDDDPNETVPGREFRLGARCHRMAGRRAILSDARGPLGPRPRARNLVAPKLPMANLALVGRTLRVRTGPWVPHLCPTITWTQRPIAGIGLQVRGQGEYMTRRLTSGRRLLDGGSERYGHAVRQARPRAITAQVGRTIITGVLADRAPVDQEHEVRLAYRRRCWLLLGRQCETGARVRAREVQHPTDTDGKATGAPRLATVRR